MTDLVALVADLIPRPQVSEHVADWPQDEQDYYRGGDWRSFSDRADSLARLRQEKAARAILAALLRAVMEPEKPQGEGEPCMPRVAGKRFFCRCGAGVFTRWDDLFVCNACETEYSSK